MKFNNTRILSVLLISFSLIYSSCSVIGYRLGAELDNSSPDYELVRPEDYKTIRSLKEIFVYLRDNSIIQGNFIKLSDSPATEDDIQDFTEKYLIIKTKMGFESVNLDEIVLVSIKASKHRKALGLTIGFVLDMISPTLLLIITDPENI